MPRGRPRKKKVEETSDETKEKKVVSYKLKAPCEFVIEEKKFDSKKMKGFKWRKKGVFSTGLGKMLVIDVEEED